MSKKKKAASAKTIWLFIGLFMAIQCLGMYRHLVAKFKSEVLYFKLGKFEENII